ncbi:hypothetical protein GQ43DRAFT_437095 [Delitschia confertaspora ATCC 74209]|uniref:RING-type domain-containing protein n=1 Tax=Delitschia confertaspora ATCC 74209 TaxID=1513339 RepID=A0A9P4JVY9_9PLEO|nr:hypothetical protein GQ43DRAFT_437095 [Delitschia confertaspora ATCC 74209]
MVRVRHLTQSLAARDTQHRSTSFITFYNILLGTNMPYKPFHAAPPGNIWDPYEVLPLKQDGRCVGYARTQGRKCLNVIASENLLKMTSLIDKISTQEPNPAALRSHLTSIAGYGLCRRWHQNQENDMVRKWSENILEHFPSRQRCPVPAVFPTESVRASSLSSTSSAAASTQEQIAQLCQIIMRQQEQLEALQAQISQTTTFTTSLSRPVTPPPPQLSHTPTYSSRVHAESPHTSEQPEQDPGARSTRTGRLHRSEPPVQSQRSSTARTGSLHTSEQPERRTSNLSPTPHSRTMSTVSSRSTSPTPSRTPTDNITPLNLSRASTSSTAPSRSRSTPPTTTAAQSQPLPPLPIPSRTVTNLKTATTTAIIIATTPSAASQCNVTHVLRRPVEDECPICQEPMLDEPLSTLVWCKSSCGRSVHKVCNDMWRTSQLRNNKQVSLLSVRVRCAICRTQWQESCTCDEASVQRE